MFNVVTSLGCFSF